MPDRQMRDKKRACILARPAIHALHVTLMMHGAVIIAQLLEVGASWGVIGEAEVDELTTYPRGPERGESSILSHSGTVMYRSDINSWRVGYTR